MQKLILLLMLSTSFIQKGSANEYAQFDKCLTEQVKDDEKKFLKSYVKYKSNSSKTNGLKVIENMQLLYKNNNNKKFDIGKVALIEGTTCGFNLLGGSNLDTVFLKIEKGWLTAIYVMLMYSRLAALDGAEGSGVEEYLSIIKTQHPWAIKMFSKAYPGI